MFSLFGGAVLPDGMIGTILPPMSSISELDELVAQLNELSPPPHDPRVMDPNNTINITPGTGEWIVVVLFGGMLALRAQYRTHSGEVVVLTPKDEVRGNPRRVGEALRWTVRILGASRHYWSRAE